MSNMVQDAPTAFGPLPDGPNRRTVQQIEGPTDVAAIVPVTIVSNSRLLREGLVRLLAAFDGISVIAEYPSDSIAIACTPNPEGHVVLLDGGIGQEAAIHWSQALGKLTPPACV